MFELRSFSVYVTSEEKKRLFAVEESTGQAEASACRATFSVVREENCFTALIPQAPQARARNSYRRTKVTEFISCQRRH
jgi:hypothetical protein